MSKHLSVYFVASLSLVASLLAPAPEAGAQPGHSRPDNNGRQLAVVLPAPPAQHAPVPAPAPGGHPASLQGAKLPARSPDSCLPGHGTGHIPAHIRSQIQSAISTPIQMTPEMRQAAEKGIVMAHGLSRVAARRFADIAAWVSTIWRQLNETPRISPNTLPGINEPPVGPMRPLADPGNSQKLYFTNEGRIKTLTGR